MPLKLIRVANVNELNLWEINYSFYQILISSEKARIICLGVMFTQRN